MPAAVLIAIIVTLVAGLAGHVGKGVPNDAPEQNANFAQTDENLSGDNPEQKRSSDEIDRGLVKKVSKKKNNICVGNCSGVWRPYGLTPWPIYEPR